MERAADDETSEQFFRIKMSNQKVKIMKSLYVKSPFILLIFSVLVSISLASCEKESDPVAMDLPPTESLVLDFEQFPSTNTKSMELTIGNWLYSSLTVLGWNVVIAANIAIPVAAYAQAFNHTPVYLGDYTWEWSYSAPVNLKTYEVDLIGKRLNNETFSMEMTLSEVGGFQDFKWFEGEIRYDHTLADWTLSYNPLEPSEYLDVHFQKDYEAEKGSIRYTVTDPDLDLFNDYIEYSIDSSLYYDASYVIVQNDSSITIEWNRLSKEGHVQSAGYFKDELWHCWDINLQDVDCNAK